MASYIHKESGRVKHAPDGSTRQHAMENDPNWKPATKKQIEEDLKQRQAEEAEHHATPGSNQTE